MAVVSPLANIMGSATVEGAGRQNMFCSKPFSGVFSTNRPNLFERRLSSSAKDYNFFFGNRFIKMFPGYEYFKKIIPTY